MLDFKIREDAFSAITLYKTLLFLLYAIVVPLLTIGLLILTPFQSISGQARSFLAVGIFLSLEAILYYFVLQARIPERALNAKNPFDEHQIALGVALLSAAPWLLRFDPVRFQVFQVVVNGFLCLAVLVFFLTKSMMSRHWRWGVLLVMLLPALQLYFVFR